MSIFESMCGLSKLKITIAIFSAVGFRFLNSLVSKIQVFMIKSFNYLLLYEIRKFFQIYHKSCFGIRFTHDFYFQLIVMPMIIR